jgi:hypothetical protein
VSRLVQPVATPPTADEARAASRTAAALDADVVEAADTEALRVELAVVGRGPEDADEVVLRGVDRASGDRRWEVVLDRAPHSGPTPLRP